MSVGCRSARRFVFVVGEKLLYFMRDRFPFSGWEVVKGIGHCAPSRIAGKDAFFRFGRIAFFGFKLLERFDGGEIVAGLVMQSALSDTVGVSYPEIAGGSFFYDRVEVK